MGYYLNIASTLTQESIDTVNRNMVINNYSYEIWADVISEDTVYKIFITI